jgi:hypothetical protein
MNSSLSLERSTSVKGKGSLSQIFWRPSHKISEPNSPRAKKEGSVLFWMSKHVKFSAQKKNGPFFFSPNIRSLHSGYRGNIFIMTRIGKKGGTKNKKQQRPAPAGVTDSQILQDDNEPGDQQMRRTLRTRKNPISYNELNVNEGSRPGDDGSDTPYVPQPAPPSEG